MNFKKTTICTAFMLGMVWTFSVHAASTSKKKPNIVQLKQKPEKKIVTRKPRTCGPYPYEQLKNKQVEAAELIQDCNLRNKNCNAAQSMISKMNQTILSADAMNYVYGNDAKSKEPRKEVIAYAINMIKTSSCISRTQDRQGQMNFIESSSPNYIFSAAIACSSNLPFFKTNDSVFRTSAPLAEQDFSTSLEYTTYRSEYYKYMKEDPWNAANIPYKIVNSYRSKASPISVSDTSRFGYLKSGGKIVPTDFEGFKNLIVSASACVYLMNNDQDRQNDDYQMLVTRDFGYLIPGK